MVRLAFAAALFILPASANSQDLGLEGTWIYGEDVSPGLSADADLSLKGKSLWIKGDNILLPDQSNCVIGAARPVVLRDDMETFGSGGGAWSNIGLVSVGNDYEYEVEILDLACAGGDSPVRIIVQSKSNTVLLDVRDGVYFRLRRPTSS